MKQKTLRVFEVEDFENLKSVIKTKYPLIKNHIFMLKEKNEEIEDLLRRNFLSYFIVNGESFTSKKETSKESIMVIEKEKVVVKNCETLIYDKIIRSGEELELSQNALFLNRINAGAKIVTSANIEIYDENEGLIIAEGEYIIVKKNVKGTIIFKGLDIGKVDRLTFISEKIKKVLE
ncbi:septum formation inhibitor [Caminibacter pacificus]|uniref:Septum formation inhibitor n=1 Tax=Caminibacter pacificus TaxID=1424653 RepID=A0AAJ4RCK0_9BACT|nr:septum formation inhibitor [Caminibacter pacificus]QCI27735.1 septum formation inhibitor [Caminibacter pacificus]ROR40090.1 septum site-determining protein MinC [Caminibacter pacificus]